VDKYLGACNKNIGEAFLLVWKFPEDLIIKDNFGDLHVDQTRKEVEVIADLALFSFLKIIAKINKLTHILEYSRD
jgi:HD-like signal output (HDOD) protein